MLITGFMWTTSKQHANELSATWWGLILTQNRKTIRNWNKIVKYICIWGEAAGGGSRMATQWLFGLVQFWEKDGFFSPNFLKMRLFLSKRANYTIFLKNLILRNLEKKNPFFTQNFPTTFFSVYSITHLSHLMQVHLKISWENFEKKSV